MPLLWFLASLCFYCEISSQEQRPSKTCSFLKRFFFFFFNQNMFSRAIFELFSHRCYKTSSFLLKEFFLCFPNSLKIIKLYIKKTMSFMSHKTGDMITKYMQFIVCYYNKSLFRRQVCIEVFVEGEARWRGNYRSENITLATYVPLNRGRKLVYSIFGMIQKLLSNRKQSVASENHAPFYHNLRAVWEIGLNTCVIMRNWFRIFLETDLKRNLQTSGVT